MPISENARAVLERRYLIRDEHGEAVETVDELFHRVADAVAAADVRFDPQADVADTARSFYRMMTELDFLPNSPTLMNAGRPLGQLSACFVLPVADSMEDIFDAIKNAALIHKSGGGTGFSFSRLRAKGSTVNSTGGVASGPISFMKVFNAATEAVKQGGTRRGANMGILRVDHPDILEFITCKNDTKEITNFNISVGLTESFMEAVESDGSYELVDPASRRVTGRLNAREVFEAIVRSAWQTGEPGILFLDRLNKDNPCPGQGEIESTNPCGEQPLLPYEACNLGSINLVRHLRRTGTGYALDRAKLEQTIRTAVHFLDNVIEVNQYPLPEIDAMTKKTRKIGLGVMGFADMLLYLGIPYDSDEGVAMASQVMELVQTIGHQESQRLAQVRGPFPLFAESVYRDGAPLRNATVTTIAPTGTLSIIAGVSSGVEPVFAYAYYRNVMDNTHLIETNQILRDKLTELGLYSDELMRQIIEHGSLAHVEGIPEAVKRVFVCAHDVSPIWHVKMQAAFQQFTDNAVSKTVNFPNSATQEEVAEVYRLAYELGCKGTTIYRDGSRDEQVLNIGVDKAKQETALPDHVEKLLESGCDSTACLLRSGSIKPRPRPDVTMGYTEKVKIGCGNLYITVNYDEQGVCEVFTNTGRAGGCPSQSEATARLMSVALRAGVDSDELIRQLKGIRCPSTIRQQGMAVTSCPDAIAKAIEKVMQASKTNQIPPCPPPMGAGRKGRPAPDMTPAESKLAKYCPECGAQLEHEGGCVTCRNCGYSKCG
ncbi:vitamin B12-dependent ribonucleotide reductase [Intestinimonas massiliensis]|uniref:Vitamin B12-dependent ribonucleotide reductase n=1 Tax=Intestinimonas massiliensis (ex Afouda et al. 2020) TaxID=1673721 RepID=A0ABS9M4J1_9FIRM|nr:vitamin B12-dependent ribonucleotide reductase [Intestinimonas massiliensis (ex Afouda et al. 2020)]MCG4525708.1 vitamin B12-dependent ribonucleotide reductase [Intestinimonas massiliensis (ex Afouda et al. 2020)]MCQ4805764.1 vitamin B12-dependent ribonucleotide reductase [Intestinimonas massiliensis (ex Afouda et al. 2020)]